MAHKTLVGGTAYNITGGKSMVSGTTYNIKKGRTLVGGTGYNINFGGGEATALLYNTGDFVFQRGTDVEEGKTLEASYTGIENKGYSPTTSAPWYNSKNRIKNVYCKDEIVPTNMAFWFYSCANLISFNNVNFNTIYLTNMNSTYYNCTKLTSSPVCGDNVTDMTQAYSGCTSLTGSPVCGNKVAAMYRTYFKCTKLTGSPVCGDNVTNMLQAYFNCFNLTGSPVCGDNVTNMKQAYSGCYNLTGSPTCGKSVIDMAGAYANCKNLSGNAYFYSSVVNKAQGCFNNRSNSKRLNIYVPANSLTNTTISQTKNTTTLVYKPISYTNAGTHYYNTRYNIYIYPVENVAAAREANGD